jgi:TusA-related sulfurtransferase
LISADVDVYDLKPVLRAHKSLASMAPGRRLWVERADPLATIDVPALCREAIICGGPSALTAVYRFLIEPG